MAQTSTAIYCRLSQDDGQVGESSSIQTQKTLLTQYCNDHHFSVFDTYCDESVIFEPSQKPLAAQGFLVWFNFFVPSQWATMT